MNSDSSIPSQILAPGSWSLLANPEGANQVPRIFPVPRTLSDASTLSCHPERSAAESKDLHFGRSATDALPAKASFRANPEQAERVEGGVEESLYFPDAPRTSAKNPQKSCQALTALNQLKINNIHVPI